MATSYVNTIQQQRDFREALFDRISELVIANYNVINPNIPISSIQKTLKDGLPKQGRESFEDTLVIYEKDTDANYQDVESFIPILNHFSTNYEVGGVDVNDINLNINNDGEISLTHPSLSPLVIGVDSLENLFINDNASQFINLSTNKNKLDVDKVKEYLDYTISEFKPKLQGDILQKRIKKLFKDFIAIKKFIKKGETFQQGEQLIFLDKSAVTLNYLIKQCLDEIYDTKCIFTEDQYTSLYNNYQALNEDYHQTISQSLVDVETNTETVSAKEEIIEEMVTNVFENVLDSFQVDSYWKEKFSKALRTYIDYGDTLYSRNDRNILVKNSWKFKPVGARTQTDNLYGYGWQVKQEQQPPEEFNSVPEINGLDTAEIVTYDEPEKIGGVYAGGRIEGNVTLTPNAFGTSGTYLESHTTLQEQGGCLKFSPSNFYYRTPTGKRYWVRTNKGVMSTMAETPYVSTEWSDSFVYINGYNDIDLLTISNDLVNVRTGDSQQAVSEELDQIPFGTVFEAYIMFVGSDTTRFGADVSGMEDGDFSKDFLVVYRGGGQPQLRPNPNADVGVFTFNNPGKKYKWYYDNGLGFNIEREFTPNENDAIVARLYRNSDTSFGIDEVNIDDYTAGFNFGGNETNQGGNIISPFTAYQSHWSSKIIPAELTFKASIGFSGEGGGQGNPSNEEVATIHLVHEPGDPLNLQSLDYKQSNWNLYHTSFKDSETYTISLYVKTDSDNPLFCQPYFSTYGRDDVNIRSNLIYPIGNFKTFTKEDNWKRLVWQSIQPPDAEAEMTDKTISIGFRFAKTNLITNSPTPGEDIGSDTSTSEETTNVNKFTVDSNPNISVAACQVEVGDIVSPWREPGEVIEGDENFGSVSTDIFEDEETSIDIEDSLFSNITEEEFTSHTTVSQELPIPGIEGSTIEGDNVFLYLNKNVNFFSTMEGFEPGDILKLVNQQDGGIEYMLFISNEAIPNQQIMKLRRGWFNSQVIPIPHDPTPPHPIEVFKISQWETSGGNVFYDDEHLELLKNISQDIGNLDKRFVINRKDFFHPYFRIVQNSHFKINNEEFYVYKQGTNAFEDRVYIKRGFNNTVPKNHAVGVVVEVDNRETDIYDPDL
tara:strand:- start:14922 stop:18242 length:3321 start_codon:yes stop_codon:yes gene_type:complete